MKTRLTKKEPEKRLLRPLKSKAGRNFTGRITVRHRGSGVKRMYRIVDFGQEKKGTKGRVVALEYDPNRTAHLALVQYEDQDKRYILAPQGLKVGDMVICDDSTEVKVGNRMMLKNIPVGFEVFNIELEPGKGGKIVRSAGSAAQVMAHEGKYCQLTMPSKEVRKVYDNCFASVGRSSNPEHRFKDMKKAGARRLKGWRPTVRGTAMNPPDHAHGGGEGRSGIGMKHPKTPWGKPALGVRTRRKKWTQKFIIKRRKK